MKDLEDVQMGIIKWLIENDAITIVTYIITVLIFPINIGLIIKEKDKKTTIISNTIGLIIAIIGISLLIVKSALVVVPNVYDLSGENARIKISDASLKYNKADFLEEDEKIVIAMDPDAGTVVKKNSQVRVIMVNKNSEIANSSVLDYLDDVTNIGNVTLYGANNDHIEFIINEVGAYISTENQSETRTLGHIKLENAKVELYDYLSNEVVYTEYSNEYGLVEFYDLKPGIYYYKVTLDGYKTYKSPTPFKLICEDREKDDLGTWVVSLEKETIEFFEYEYMVKATKNSKPVMGKEFLITVFNNDYLEECPQSLPLFTNEKGEFSLRARIISDGKTIDKLYPITIKQAKNYNIQIQCDNQIVSKIYNVEKDTLVIDLSE